MKEREQLVAFLLPRYSKGYSYVKNRFKTFSTAELRSMVAFWKG